MNIERLLAPIKSRIRLMIGKCLITACSGQKVAISLFVGENREDVDFFQQYGFSSNPKGSVSGISLFLGGSRDNGAVVACRGEDSNMVAKLEPGEVMVHSPFGSSITLKKDGSIALVSGNGVLTFDGELQVTKEVTANYGTAPIKLSTHIHPTPVGPSSPPTIGT